MSKLSFDYSKWDRLELSDDEDSFHPNLDKNLNIRVNRITRDRKEEELDEDIKKAVEVGDHKKAAQVESKRPLHVGNLCRVAEERTIINSSDGSRKDRTVKGEEEFQIDDYMQFKTDHQKMLEEYTNADWQTSRNMLHAHGDILLDDCANNYFMLTALDQEMAGNTALVEKLARQGQIISQIHQLAKPMNRPPRDLVQRFFDKFDAGVAQDAFQEGVNHFLGHIRRRAVDKKKEEAEEAEAAAAEAERQQAEAEGEKLPLVEAMYSMTPEERKGPGGLDPVVVFESLPEDMQTCFKSGDVDGLREISTKMDRQTFEGHFKRCIDSGLWSTGGS
jgi:cell division cycle protein 37